MEIGKQIHKPKGFRRKIKMNNTSHLDALNVRLSHERSYLLEAKTNQEKELRKVWISQIEKEIEKEKEFLNMKTFAPSAVSDDDLLNELFND
jgi:hypothetical protein